MNKIIETWVENVKTYPPAEIFFEKYGKEAKSEKRVQDLCEELYRFCFPEGEKSILSDLFQAYREFEVAHVLGFKGMKPEYLSKVKDKFLEEAKYTIKALDNLFKKDQLLQKYYADWKLKYSELETEVYKMTKEYL